VLAEIGQVLLLAALCSCVLQAVLPLAGAARGTPSLMAVGRPAALTHLVLVAAAFAVLAWAFVAQDFSLRYVADNSNLALPLVYRLSAVWGAHEGSLLMWPCAAAICRRALAHACSAPWAW
jgi:cytochrome c-type biogenesis protein CcmF